MWSILLITLPTQPNAVRIRIWRALKALGCVALRDGSYLLPAAQANRLEALGTEAREHGGEAHVLNLFPRSKAQEAEVLARFAAAAAAAQRAGLGVNAGHDLNRDNLADFLAAVPGTLEVSIGHALIADALEFGMTETIHAYLRALRAAKA